MIIPDVKFFFNKKIIRGKFKFRAVCRHESASQFATHQQHEVFYITNIRIATTKIRSVLVVNKPYYSHKATLQIFADFGFSAHIRLKLCRNIDAAVFILMAFNKRH